MTWTRSRGAGRSRPACHRRRRGHGLKRLDGTRVDPGHIAGGVWFAVEAGAR